MQLVGVCIALRDRFGKGPPSLELLLGQPLGLLMAGHFRLEQTRSIRQSNNAKSSQHPLCVVGQRMAETDMEANQDTELVLTSGDRHETCVIAQSSEPRLARR